MITFEPSLPVCNSDLLRRRWPMHHTAELQGHGLAASPLRS